MDIFIFCMTFQTPMPKNEEWNCWYNGLLHFILWLCEGKVIWNFLILCFILLEINLMYNFLHWNQIKVLMFKIIIGFKFEFDWLIV